MVSFTTQLLSVWEDSPAIFPAQDPVTACTWRQTSTFCPYKEPKNGYPASGQTTLTGLYQSDNVQETKKYFHAIHGEDRKRCVPRGSTQALSGHSLPPEYHMVSWYTLSV